MLLVSNHLSVRNHFPTSYPRFVLVSHRVPLATLGIDGTKSAYVPPHLRASQRAASSPSSPDGCVFLAPLSPLSRVLSAPRSGWNDSRTSSPFRSGYSGRGNFGDKSANGHVPPFGGSRRNDSWGERPQNSYGGGGPRHESGPRETFGYGVWRDGQHVVGARNMRLEKELYGDAEDPSKQHTGINFEKYDDIPVEATGAGVPEPVTAFTSPPLDPVLLENISSARYTTPTPVQKYSIPIVAAGRDLMACAQVCFINMSSTLPSNLYTDWFWQDWGLFVPYPLCIFFEWSSHPSNWGERTIL